MESTTPQGGGKQEDEKKAVFRRGEVGTLEAKVRAEQQAGGRIVGDIGTGVRENPDGGAGAACFGENRKRGEGECGKKKGVFRRRGGGAWKAYPVWKKTSRFRDSRHGFQRGVRGPAKRFQYCRQKGQRKDGPVIK